MSTEDSIANEPSPNRTSGKYIVRCGAMRTLCVLKSKEDFTYGVKVIARTPRGVEFGEILCPATAQAITHLVDPPEGQVLRRLTTEDENELAHLGSRAEDEFAACKRAIGDLKLDMQLVDVEHLFGGERVVVYYLAESRVDFRELVRRLASEFRTRVEMRQIGVRDEAKLLADYGDCGKPVCCNTHLTKMPPVSMKMAKLQKASLDPTKISGRCGRLKCCLRYEYDTYQSLQRALPPIGSDIVTSEGRGRVVAQEILAQKVLINYEGGTTKMTDASEIVTVVSGKNSGKK